MNLFVQIKQKTYSANVVQGATISDEFNENLDSCSIIIKKIPKINISPFEDVIVRNEDSSFRRHFIVANKGVKMVNLTNGLFDFTIDLVSETKGLERIVLPNIVYKQPVIRTIRESLYTVVKRYVETYSPFRKKAKANETWEYESKYLLIDDENLDIVKKMQKTICPEFSLNQPTLRELLNYLFSAIDYIPKVENGIITGINIGKETGTFEFTDHENYIDYSQTLEGYSNNLIKNYSQGLSEDGCSRIVEKIGFRDSASASIKLDGLKIETSFPIYSINKIYMYSWREISVYNNNLRRDESRYLLIKHDITPFIVSSEYRNYLNPTTISTSVPLPDLTNDNTRASSIAEISKYQIMTLAFNRGSRDISGWGYGFSYYDPTTLLGTLGWVQTSETFLENLLNLMGFVYPYGTGETAATIQEKLEDGILLVDSGNGGVADINSYISSHMVLPIRVGSSGKYNLTLKLKSVFFELDYNALTSGKVEISKVGNFEEKNSIVDNQSGSMVSLVLDGEHSLLKAARMANELLQFRGRYTDINDIIPLGSKNEDGNVIFRRTISFYNNVILVNYAATKNYILQNYFTSVRSKIRNTNLISTEESSISSINRVVHVVFSKDKCYFDLLGSDFVNNVDWYEVLMSAFLEKNDLYKINVAIFTYNGRQFMQEVNTYIVGAHSLCFTMQTRGNQFIGMYISNFYPSMDKIGKALDSNGTAVDNVEVIGSMQSPYIISDTQSGITYDYGIEFSHYEPSYLPALLDTGIVSSMNDIYDAFDYLLLKPLMNPANDRILFSLPGKQNLWKNNGEIVNFTTQIDYSETDPDICLGKYFLKLNNMFSETDKFFETKEKLVKGFTINFLQSVTDYDADIGDIHPLYYYSSSRPVAIMELDKGIFNLLVDLSPSVSVNNPIELGDVEITWKATNQTTNNPKILDNFSLSITFKKIIGFYSSSGQGAGTFSDRMRVSVHVKRIESGTITEQDIVIDFRRFYTGANPIDNFLFYQYPNAEGKISFGWDAIYDNLDLFATNQSSSPAYLFLDGAFFYQYSNSSKNTYNILTLYAENSSGIVVASQNPQNCFVFFGGEEIDFRKEQLGIKQLSLNDLEDLGLWQSEQKVYETFLISKDEYNRENIKINISSDTEGLRNIRTVCYFFYDEDPQKYSLVYGQNINAEDMETVEEEKEVEFKNIFYANHDYYVTSADVGNTFEYQLVSNSLSAAANINPQAYYLLSNQQYKLYVGGSEPWSSAHIYVYNWSTNELIQDIDLSNLRERTVLLNIEADGYYYFIYRFVPDYAAGSAQDPLYVIVSIYEYDNDFTSAQETTLKNNAGTVTLTKTITYERTLQKIYISLLEDKNINVYDNDGMIVGTNKNWASDDVSENVSNKYSPLEEE